MHESSTKSFIIGIKFLIQMRNFNATNSMFEQWWYWFVFVFCANSKIRGHAKLWNSLWMNVDCANFAIKDFDQTTFLKLRKHLTFFLAKEFHLPFALILTNILQTFFSDKSFSENVCNTHSSGITYKLFKILYLNRHLHTGDTLSVMPFT